MNTTKNKLLLLLILVIPILFLTSCEDLSDDDWELVEIAFESWAEENGLLENDQWQPDGVVVKAVEDTIGDITNAEEEIQFDGIKVIRDIEQADEIAKEAVMQEDLEKMQTAIDLRPEDWRLQEQNAVLWASIWSTKRDDDEAFLAENPAEESGVHTAEDMIREQVKQGGDCVKLRTQQLEYRENLLSEALNDCSENTDCDESYMAWELAMVQESLYNLYDGKPSLWCDLAK